MTMSIHCFVLGLKNCKISDNLKVNVCLKYQPINLQFYFILIFRRSLYGIANIEGAKSLKNLVSLLPTKGEKL